MSMVKEWALIPCTMFGSFSPTGKQGETSLQRLCLCHFLEAQKAIQGTCLWRLTGVPNCQICIWKLARVWGKQAQVLYPLVRHPHPLLLSIMHMSLWLSVLVVIQRDHKVKVSQKSLPFALAFVFHPHLALAHCLHFVSMAWTSRLLEGSKIFEKHKYILLTIIIIVTMIMNNLT